jgi:hypothetical protein
MPRDYDAQSRRPRALLGLVAAAAAGLAVTIPLVLSMGSSGAANHRLTARNDAAATACSGYVTQITASAQPGTVSESVVDSYATTAGGLQQWMSQFTAAVPTVIQSLASTADVSACILQGTYEVPAGVNGTANETIEVVMIGPDGTGNPVMWGPSAVAAAAAPAAG